eukprot:5757590-Amphidinium_carterae.1
MIFVWTVLVVSGSSFLHTAVLCVVECAVWVGAGALFPGRMLPENQSLLRSFSTVQVWTHGPSGTAHSDVIPRHKTT